MNKPLCERDIYQFLCNQPALWFSARHIHNCLIVWNRREIEWSLESMTSKGMLECSVNIWRLQQ